MPITELECHPFLNYYQNFNYNNESIKGLIIGSFPIYQCTDSINENLEVVEQRDNNVESNIKFFYGSKKSKLWSFLSAIFDSHDFINDLDLNRNEKRESAINLLFDNNILISDSIVRTNRFNYSSDDTDLLISNGAPNWIIDNMGFNLDLVNLLENHKKIDSLYFTSIIENGNSPYSIFKNILLDQEFEEIEHFNPNNKNWAKIIRVNNRHFKVFFLPTPKERTIVLTPNQQHPLFVNYLNSLLGNNFVTNLIFPMNDDLKNQIQVHRKNFLIEMYKQAIVNNNLNFDGAII